MSIRLRFTLLYTVILALTLTAFGVMLYTIQSGATMKTQEDILADFARRLADGRRLQAKLDIQPRPDPPPEREWKDFRPETNSPFQEQDIFFQLYNLNGEILFQSDNAADLELEIPLSDEGMAAILQGENWIETARLNGERLLIYSEPVMWEGEILEYAQVTRSLANRDSNLDSLATNMLIGGSIVVIAAFGIGWLLSGLVLQPINRITGTAREIGTERDFGRRVEFAGPNDEVGQLATTFNQMLTELQAAYQQLEEALQFQRRFVADVSHELRTPLTTIRGNIELLRRLPPISPEDQDAVVTDIVEETERLIRLVNDLLLLERSDAGQHLRNQAVWIKHLVEEACHSLKPLDPDRSVQRSNVHDVAVVGDPDAVKQVILILLNNAFTHTDGKIEIDTSVMPDHVAISIRDAGPGIDPAILPDIFERFYRGENARGKPGTGLGLPIARNLVEAQSGTLEVESTIEAGSIFTITLPRAKTPAE